MRRLSILQSASSVAPDNPLEWELAALQACAMLEHDAGEINGFAPPAGRPGAGAYRLLARPIPNRACQPQRQFATLDQYRYEHLSETPSR